MRKYDVIVIGGGISGCMAAVSAARAGVSVLLAEQYGFLGGTLTVCGTGPMMTFHAGKTLAVQGICNELIERLKEKGLSTGHIFDTTNYTYTVTPFDAEGMKRELEIMCLEAGVTLLYHCHLTGVIREDDRIQGIEVAHKLGKEWLEACFVVDATGDADVTYLLGEPFTKGRPSDGKTQPLTMNMRLCNVDIERVKAYMRKAPDQFPGLRNDASTIDLAPRLSTGGYKDMFRNAMRTGRVSFPREDVLFFESNTPGEVIVNTTRVIDVDPTDPFGLTKAEVLGRQQAWELLTLLREEAEGFENAHLMYTGPFIGVRGSRQIEAAHTLTAEELMNCVPFADTIAHGGYPIDVHPPEGFDEKNGTNSDFLSGQMYSIPLSCMYGKIKNLVTVGRCVGATFEAQAAIRVSPIAGAIGHAGGAAAAVCVKSDADVQTADYQAIKRLLLSQGAFLKESQNGLV